MIADMTQRFPQGMYDIEEPERESSGKTLREALAIYEQYELDGDFYNRVRVTDGTHDLYDGHELSEVRYLHPELLDREVSYFWWHDIDILFVLEH